MKMLKDVRVLDLGSFITAPYAAMLLAELGADVIKVERPQGGDPFRSFRGGLYSPQFFAHNRGKRSVALDYASDAGHQGLLDLVRSADVVILNMREGAIRKFRLGEPELRAVNPRLIYCAITGFGPDGPYADRPAYDTVGQALSGWLSLFHSSRDPRIAGPATCDAITGLFAAQGILAALYERQCSGKGRKVEVSMLEANIAFATEPFAQMSVADEPIGPFSRAAASQSFVLTCSDGGRIGLHLSSPAKFWHALLAAVDAPALRDDVRFATRDGRVACYEALGQVLAGIFAGRTRAQWEERLRQHDVPFAPVLGLAEVGGDPQVRHVAPFYRVEHASQGSFTGIHCPVRFDGARMPIPSAPPELGEHTADLLPRPSV